MDDLNGLDWSARPNGTQVPPRNTYNPSPFSYTATPQPTLTAQLPTRPASGLTGSARIGSPTKPASSSAADSFSNLLPNAATKAKTNLTLQDRQKQLLQERQKQIEEQQKRHANDAHLWNTLGSSARACPAPPLASANGHAVEEDEDDILAAFNSNAKVDRSSHFPPPSTASQSARSTPMLSQTTTRSNGMNNDRLDDDDDIFGLGSIQAQRPVAQQAPPAPGHDSSDDDFLGDLGKPFKPKPVVARQASPPPRQDSPPDIQREKANSTPLDRSIAELVDMGFPTDKARAALEETNGNVQSAVGWLLNQAHADAKQKAEGRSGQRQAISPSAQTNERANTPTWLQQDSRAGSQPRRPDSSNSNSDRELSQKASEVGASFLKSANSLWKAGRKQMQKAVADMQHDVGDPSQPKWMLDASSDSQRSAGPLHSRHPQTSDPAQARQQSGPVDMTDEAMLLEARDSRQLRPKSNPRMPNEPTMPSPLRGRSPVQVLPERSGPTQRLPQQPASQIRQPTKLSREQVEAQASQVYVSSARRRKPAAPAAVSPQPEVDLFSPPPAKVQQAPTPRPQPSTSSSRSDSMARPAAPSRNVPAIAPSILSKSAQHRAAGTDAFKRGAFDAAHQAYTAALIPLPRDHPITIIVLSNRALTAIKTGDPKMAIQDADKALTIIGPSRGENESIDLGAEGKKDMKELYGKALMRKAEALEAMEKWQDALAVWRLAIEGGVGGAAAVRGRDRCTKVANPAPAPKTIMSKPVQASRAPPRKVEPSRPKVASGDAEAVRRLREQNAAAEKLDDEKFALSDAVSAKIESWRGGKSDNLRALLASLDAVLWDGAGWKKVSIAELVLPNKVKIIYMKAIAKVHPDKISQSATTEQRMISGSVFSTLNEAWDKFKTENNM